MDSEDQTKTRKSAYELVMAIFRALPVRGTKSKTQIAKEIGSKESTVENYLELIMTIQGMPQVNRESTGTRRYGYRRARAKKESS